MKILDSFYVFFCFVGLGKVASFLNKALIFEMCEREKKKAFEYCIYNIGSF
jgi:hypothetical protein